MHVLIGPAMCTEITFRWYLDVLTPPNEKRKSGVEKNKTPFVLISSRAAFMDAAPSTMTYKYDHFSFRELRGHHLTVERGSVV